MNTILLKLVNKNLVYHISARRKQQHERVQYPLKPHIMEKWIVHKKFLANGAY